MSSVKSSAFVIGAALVLNGLCSAQTMNPDATAMGASTAQPLDLRVGIARPGPMGTMTDGDVRAAAPRQSQPTASVSLGKDYRVAPNDLIEVVVYEADNLKRTVRVSAGGAISLPLIGQVPVAGQTAEEIEQHVAARYAEKYLQNPQVSIFVKEFTTERITIEGAVSRPGIFPLTGQLTLLRAMALAGGFGAIANTSQVMLYRVNDQRVREVSVYDVEKIRAGKNEDPPLKSDDLIVVQRDSTRALLKDSVFRDVLDSFNPFSILMPR